ncbi:DNA cytosine methyltransferase [Pseudomonas sp. PI1]|uniref:DNA cytosine methyltransferase n=1 Tax=Pseudomonas sp. PI1 TaxID=1582493 RepID=UPI0005BE1CF2|nr:DNA cytosine methyltransferase [Pseudomonas sp. PI1]KWR82516.1 methyltransferase [Pseudomonas sp. PI1]
MPSAYYNEIDPYAAQWLRNLIAAGHIAPGDVDERSIEDVHPDDLRHYTQCHFFAGIGVWSLALRRAGWPDNRPVWTGSCPCQPFSEGGAQLGFADERHLWPAWHHLIGERKPGVIFGEQVASKAGLAWLDLVQADLEGTGYACSAFDICSAGVGAPHLRQRLWIVAHSNSARRYRQPKRDEQQKGRQSASWGDDVDRCGLSPWSGAIEVEGADGTRRLLEPGIEPLADGDTDRGGRLRAYGNAINAEAATQFIAAYLEATS